MRTFLLGVLSASVLAATLPSVANAIDPRERVPDSIAKPSDEIEKGPDFDPPLNLLGGRLSGDLNVDLGFTEDPKNPSSDAQSDFFMSADISALFSVSEIFSIIGDFSIFSMGEKLTRSLFDQPAVGLNELYVFADVIEERLALFAGKLEPEFESSFGLADGVFDIGYRNDLEHSSSLGFGGEYYFNVAGFDHKFSAVAYLQDRTFLSQTLINDTERLRKREGGLANTSGPESFVLRLAGDLDRFDYVLAFRRQEDAVAEGLLDDEDLDDEDGEDEDLEEGDLADDGDEEEEEADEAGSSDRSHDETALLVGVGFKLIDSPEQGVLRLAGETAWLNNFGGEDLDAHFWSVGATYEKDQFLLGLSHVQRDIEGEEIDNFTVFSAEYDFGEGFFAGAEVARFLEDRQIRTAWGAQLSYRHGF